MPTDVVGSGLPWVDAIARSFEHYSFADFHRVDLPRLIARNGHLVVDDLRGVPPLSFRAGDHAFTWMVTAESLRIDDGVADDATVVDLSEETFSEFIHELLTASGAVRIGRAKVTGGELAGWQRWEAAIQSLCSGR